MIILVEMENEMNRIAQFSKVSKENFLAAIADDYAQFSKAEAEQMYEMISLPKRATKGSAGYDFYSPIKFVLSPNNTIKMPTGIRCKMKRNYGLFLMPRSGLGFKFREQLDNTIKEANVNKVLFFIRYLQN